MPTPEDYKRHFTMHRTDTVDYITCVRGEIWLMTDTDEVLMTPGDTVVIRGVNHAWACQQVGHALFNCNCHA